MATRIQLRRDTAANWTAVNPVLAEGEIGYETDTKKAKIGDSVSDWVSLLYSVDLAHAARTDNPHDVTADQVGAYTEGETDDLLASLQAALQQYADAAAAGVVDTAPETLDTLNELAAALGDDPNFAATVSQQIGAKANASETPLGSPAGAANGDLWTYDAASGGWLAKAPVVSTQATGAFHAYGTVNQADIPNSVFTKVLFPSEEADVSGWYDAANSRYAPQRPGYYGFSAKIQLGPTVNAKRVVASLFKNGVRYKDLSYQHTSGEQQDIGVGGAVNGVYANGSTDYFEVFVWHDFGVSTSDLISRRNAAWFTGKFEGDS